MVVDRDANINARVLFVRDTTIGAAASMSAACITHPLDVLKVRMALHGENEGRGARRTAAGMSSLRARVALTRQIVFTERSASLYAGLSAALLRQALYSGTRFAIYGEMKSRLEPSSTCDCERTSSPPMPLYRRLAATSLAGGSAAIVACPADVVLVRMQADRRLPAPQRRNYRNAFHGLYAMATTSSGGGVRSFYRGLGPLLSRGICVTSAQFATYETAKASLLSNCQWPDDPRTHCASGMVAGTAAALVSTPLDVIKSRMMNSSASSGDRSTTVAYRSSWHCLQHTLHTEGSRALFKGLTPCAMRMIPQVVIMWQFVEQYSRLWDRLLVQSETCCL